MKVKDFFWLGVGLAFCKVGYGVANGLIKGTVDILNTLIKKEPKPEETEKVDGEA